MFLSESSADEFQNQLFRKNLSGIPSECQTVWIQVRLDLEPTCLQRLAGKELTLSLL